MAKKPKERLTVTAEKLRVAKSSILRFISAALEGENYGPFAGLSSEAILKKVIREIKEYKLKLKPGMGILGSSGGVQRFYDVLCTNYNGGEMLKQMLNDVNFLVDNVS